MNRTHLYGDDSGGWLPFTSYAPGGIFWFMGPFPNPTGTRLDIGWAQTRVIHALSPVENQSWINFVNQRLTQSEVGDGAD